MGKLGAVLAAGLLALAVGCGGEPSTDGESASEDLQQSGCDTPDAPNDDVGNLHKYDVYRERFRREFISVSADNDPGTNLPVSKREGGTLHWGDTTILVGQYLGMLATEYALLAPRQPERAATTLKELHYALAALDRLDQRAESYFRSDRSSTQDDLNGFFIRDDVESDFLTRHPIDKATNVESGTTAPYGGKPGYGATEMSQDQVWHLLVGLALVKKLVGATPDETGLGAPFEWHAKNITFRILGYMRNNEDWRTQNPIFHKPVLRGGDWDAESVFSYGFATAGNWILAPDAPFDKPYPDLHNDASRSAEGAFRLSRLFKGDNYNQRALSTVGDINYFTDLSAHSPLWRLEHQTLSENVFKYEHFPLISVLLHGGSTRLDKQIYGGLLNAAPPDGPSNRGDGKYTCAWSSTSRLVWPEGLGKEQGEFNGLDYLYLHNLYQLVYNAPNLDKLYGTEATPSDAH